MLKKFWVFTLAAATALCAVSVSTAQLPVEDGLLLWLDATDAESVSVDGDCVDTWSDKSGNGFDAVLPLDNFDACPAYSPDAMNGNPAIRFHAATADGMEILDIDVFEREYTAYIVNQYWEDTEAGTGGRRGRTLQGADSNWLLGLWGGNVGHFATGWISNPQPLARRNFVYVAEGVGYELESSFRANGGDLTNDPAPVGNPGGLGLVGAGQHPTELSDADISEVIFFDRALSDAELGMMRDYLHTKYDAVLCDPFDEDSECWVPTDPLNVIAGSVGTFTTATDLDFQGDFAYAINVGGPDLIDDIDPLVIGDAEFIAGTNADIDDVDTNGTGVSMTVQHEIASWFQTVDNFGEGTLDDDNLAFAMQSIRWTNKNDGISLDVNMEVEEGQSYKLQMLMGEQCCTRGFDISVEDELVVDNLLVADVQDGTIDTVANGIAATDTGVSYTLELTAEDTELNISLHGELVGAPDNNPILHVLTLEKIESIGPTCNDMSGGDLDGNGKVEFADFLILSGNFGNEVASHEQGDIDCNGKVEFADFLVLSGNFGNEVGGTQSVPEPAGQMMLVLAGMIGLLIRRRR